MKKNLVDNFFNLDISRRKGFPQGEKMVSNHVLQGRNFSKEKGSKFP
jgi:hypothetical protein